MNISKTLAKCVAVLGVGVAAFVPSQARETTASTLERGIEPREISLSPLAGDGAVRTGVKPVRAPLSAALPTGSEPAATVKQLPARAAQNRPALYGSVVSANSWTPGNKASKTGIYRIPVSQGEAFEAVSVGADAPNASNGGAMVGDTYYAANIYDGFLTYYYMSSYNPETWERIRRSNTGSKGCMAYDLACDPVTGKTYGCFLKEYGTGYVFGSYNFATNAVSLVRNVANPYVALAFDADGQLYGMAAQVDDVSGAVTGSTLYAIDKASGAPTVVGHNACKPYYNTSAVIDPSSNRMYWTVSEADASSALYEVNLISGAAVKVCDFADGEQVCGLYIDTPPAAAGAPAAPVDVTASFPGGALSGSVSFTVPATLFDGTPATGTVSYAVLHGTTVMASGTAAHGATVTAPFAVASGGNYEFAVRLSNAVGDSPDTKVSVFVGTGTPAKPQVTARYENGQMHVEWTAVTESQDGGYIDPTAVTYKVVRYPSRFVSAAATTATSLDEQVDEPDNLSEFYYTVEASYAGGNSGEARSNTVVLGALRAPYSNSLGTPESLDYWTVLDVNDDGKTFGFQSNENAVGIGYNREKPMDDWLITPPIKLEAGKSYRFTFEARTMSTDEETFEVKLGSQPLASAMTVDVIPATEFLSVAYRQFEGYLVAPATGKYYLGIHACSPAYTYRLYVRNLNIESPQSAAGPGAPTELRAIPDPNGAFRATIKLKAPTVDFDGNELSELTAVEIMRGQTVVKTFNNPEPGSELTYTDELTEAGDVEYTAVASNRFGRGKVAVTSLYVGINQPAAPENVNLVETGNHGEVKMTWDIVDRDFQGNPLNPQLVTYTIWQLQAETHVVVHDGITGNEFTFRAVEPGDQKMVHYYVSAEAGERLSPVVDSPLIHCGTPYALPFMETFKGPGTDSWIGIDETGTSTWNVYSDRDIAGLASVTGDNGFVGSKGQAEGDFSSIYTGKIEIPADFIRPGLTFYTYNIFNDGINDTNQLEISVCDLTAGQTEYSRIATVKIADISDSQGWVLVSQPLDDYKGHVIQIDIRTVVGNYPLTFIDDITVGTLTERDLAIEAFEAPAEVMANRDFTLAVRVANMGILPVESYNVALLRDGTEVEVKSVTDQLLPGKSDQVEFVQRFDAMQQGAATFVAEVRLDGEENQADNVSEPLAVTLKVLPLPVVTDLSAGFTADRSPVTLTWTTPDTDGYEPLPVTDDFESYAPFAETGVGEWLFVDGDGMPVGAITDVTLPGIEWFTPHAWWVMDNTGLNESFKASSGTKYLAQMYAVSDPQATQAMKCDDWIISPMLTGQAQTLTFKARSYSATYAETFEVLWSDGSTELADFNKIAARNEIAATWQTYTFAIPEGARRFAIRCTSYNRFMLFVDDVTFIPESERNLTVEGYNVWRDGQLITPVPVTGTSYVDNDEAALAHASKYVVTTVYDKGESAASNEAVPGFVSIDGPDAGCVAVYAAQGRVIVKGAAGRHISLCGADGRSFYSGVVAGDVASYGVPSGIVVVKAGDSVFKLIVE